MAQNYKEFFSGATANGDSSEFTWDKDEETIVISGTFDGATITLKQKDTAGGDYVNIPGGAFTAGTAVRVKAGKGSVVKATISSAGASTSITARTVL